MRSFTADTATPAAIVDELLRGGGAVVISGLFSPDDIANARAVIMGPIAANRILPGGPGQEPHVDYPYPEVLDAAAAGNTEGRT